MNESTSKNFQIIKSPLLTVEETASILNVSKETVYRLTSLKEIPYIRIRNCLRYRLSSIVDYLEKQEVKNA
ncbi:MAG: helix-turn-helix domain-containing protein [Spirochaetales bacterium]|nr:helix-turn-helix domain-containing protein [Spirochaetales bacterium]